MVIEDLIYNYLQGDLSQSELDKLLVWLEDETNYQHFCHIIEKSNIQEQLDHYDRFDIKTGYKRFQYYRKAMILQQWLPRIRRAMILIFVIGATLALLWMIPISDSTVAGRHYADVVILELPDGVILPVEGDTLQDLKLTTTNHIRYNHEVLEMLSEQPNHKDSVQLISLRTPRGKQYKIKLPDGSLVTLNAESKLCFPTTFSNNNRIVYAQGEFYFEVIKNTNVPFLVVLNNGTTIQVLGTEFNIRAYDPELVTTSLFRGTVQIDHQGKSLLLKPGFAATSGDNQITQAYRFNPKTISAWREHRFRYEKIRLEELLEDVSRYYDLNIFYENSSIRNELFTLDIAYTQTVDSLINLLQHTGTVKFTLQHKTLIVR